MSFYKISCDKSKSYLIDAVHKYSIPGMICDICKSKWAVTGIQYPNIVLSNEYAEYEEYYSIRKPYPWQTHHEMKPTTDNLFKDMFVLPGTKFGPLQGIAKGRFYDFAWLNPWTLLVSYNAYELLKKEDIKLPKVAKTKIVMNDKRDFDYYEFQIIPKARILDYPIEKCERCGRIPITMPDKIKISISPKLLDEEVFRIVELPTAIIVTENFKNIVEKLEFKDICFTKIENE